MNFIKQISFAAVAIFPLFSFAALTVDKESIYNTDKAKIVFSIDREVIGDIYIAKAFKGQLEYLSKQEQRWISIGNKTAKPYLSGKITGGKVKEIVVSASANGVNTPAGEYSFFLLIVELNADPFIESNWKSFESQSIKVNVPDDSENDESNSVNPEPINPGQTSSLNSARTTLDNKDTTKVSVSFSSMELSDQYLIVENGDQFWFLNQEGSFGNEITPFAIDVMSVEDKNILEIKAEQVNPGKYILYHLVAEAETDPFDDTDWQVELDDLVDENNKLIFSIN
jgi:hypothetical protein